MSHKLIMSERRHSKSVILEFKFYIFRFFWQSTNIKHVETLNFFKSKRVVCPYIYEGLETNSVWEADMFMRFKDVQKPQKGYSLLRSYDKIFDPSVCDNFDTGGL